MSDLADLIGIVTAILTIAFFVYPETRSWLEEKVYFIRQNSNTCLIMVISGSLLLLLIIAIPRTARAIKTWVATVTPTPTITLTPTPVPTATLTPTPSYTFLFSDNFDSGASPNWVPFEGIWQMVNNRYTMTNISDSWTFGETLVGDTTWTDYHLGVTIYLPSSIASIDNRAEIIVRSQDALNYLVLVINSSALFDSDSSRATWFIVSNGQATALVTTSFSVTAFADQYYLEVEVQGDIITTIVDGKEVTRWSDAPFLNGKAGLAIYSRNASQPPSFDNFYVRLITPY